MTIEQAEKGLRSDLGSIYDDREAAAVAALLMEHLTGMSRAQRAARRDDSLDEEGQQRYREASKRLLQHEPLQYVTGEALFCGLRLHVDRGVLIPRPETEELVEWIVHEVRAEGLSVFSQPPGAADATRTLRILDAGTGSGCIALALKHRMPRAEVWGTDLSDAALTVARRNGSELDIRVDFVALDFLDAAQRRQLPQIDILVSNPPYVPHKDAATMQPNVLQYEPHIALFVDDSDPLLFYRALAAFGRDHLNSGGTIYCELHEDLAHPTADLFRQEGYADVEIRRDMQGKERMLKAIWNP